MDTSDIDTGLQTAVTQEPVRLSMCGGKRWYFSAGSTEPIDAQGLVAWIAGPGAVALVERGVMHPFDPLGLQMGIPGDFPDQIKRELAAEGWAAVLRRAIKHVQHLASTAPRTTLAAANWDGDTEAVAAVERVIPGADRLPLQVKQEIARDGWPAVLIRALEDNRGQVRNAFVDGIGLAETGDIARFATWAAAADSYMAGRLGDHGPTFGNPATMNTAAALRRVRYAYLDGAEAERTRSPGGRSADVDEYVDRVRQQLRSASGRLGDDDAPDRRVEMTAALGLVGPDASWGSLVNHARNLVSSDGQLMAARTAEQNTRTLNRELRAEADEVETVRREIAYAMGVGAGLSWPDLAASVRLLVEQSVKAHAKAERAEHGQRELSARMDAAAREDREQLADALAVSREQEWEELITKVRTVVSDLELLHDVRCRELTEALGLLGTLPQPQWSALLVAARRAVDHEAVKLSAAANQLARDRTDLAAALGVYHGDHPPPDWIAMINAVTVAVPKATQRDHEMKAIAQAVGALTTRNVADVLEAITRLQEKLATATSATASELAVVRRNIAAEIVETIRSATGMEWPDGTDPRDVVVHLASSWQAFKATAEELRAEMVRDADPVKLREALDQLGDDPSGTCDECGEGTVCPTCGHCQDCDGCKGPQAHGQAPVMLSMHELIPDALMAALESLMTIMATDSRDWAAVRADAWMYGLVMGWGDDLAEVAQRHRWHAPAVARLLALHRAIASAVPLDASDVDDAELGALTDLLDRVGSFDLRDRTPAALCSIIRKLAEAMIEAGLGESD